MASITKENYLKTTYFLSQKTPDVSLTDIAKDLGVSIPTVNSMVKKLEAEGWVKYEKYKPLKITAKGKKAAAGIIRNHRLTEMFLVKIMGFTWEEVHDIAEEVEHIKSEKLFDRMDELLQFPVVDPHGSPIPDKEGNIPAQNYKRLSEITSPMKMRLRALAESSKPFLVFLNDKKIALGMEIIIHKVEPFDKSYNVAFGKNPPMNLSRDIAELLLVEPY